MERLDIRNFGIFFFTQNLSLDARLGLINIEKLRIKSFSLQKETQTHQNNLDWMSWTLICKCRHPKTNSFSDLFLVINKRFLFASKAATAKWFPRKKSSQKFFGKRIKRKSARKLFLCPKAMTFVRKRERLSKERIYDVMELIAKVLSHISYASNRLALTAKILADFESSCWSNKYQTCTSKAPWRQLSSQVLYIETWGREP